MFLPTKEQLDKAVSPEFDPTGLKSSDPGAKLDAGKIRVALLKRFGLALMALADLATSGAKKYSDHGWAEVENGMERYDDAMAGHWLKQMFEPDDPEMNMPHEVAVVFNAMARLQKMIENDPVWKAQMLARKATPRKIPNICACSNTNQSTLIGDDSVNLQQIERII